MQSYDLWSGVGRGVSTSAVVASPAFTLGPPCPPTCPPTVGAGLLVGAISTVIEEVAAEIGADALLVLAQELVLVLAAALGLGRGRLCGSTGSGCAALRPRAPSPAGASGCERCGRDQAGNQDDCTRLPVLRRSSGQTNPQCLGWTQGPARTSPRAVVTHCPVHAGAEQRPWAAPLTAVLLIRVVSTIVNAVALSTDPQTYPVILAAERSVGGTLEFHCTSKQKQTVTVKGDAIARRPHLSQAAAQPLPALRGGLSRQGEQVPETEAKRLKQRQSRGCWPSWRRVSPLLTQPPALAVPALLCQPHARLSTSATPLSRPEPPPAPWPHHLPPRGPI